MSQPNFGGTEYFGSSPYAGGSTYGGNVYGGSAYGGSAYGGNAYGGSLMLDNRMPGGVISLLVEASTIVSLIVMVLYLYGGSAPWWVWLWSILSLVLYIVNEFAVGSGKNNLTYLFSR